MREVSAVVGMSVPGRLAFRDGVFTGNERIMEEQIVDTACTEPYDGSHVAFRGVLL